VSDELESLFVSGKEIDKKLIAEMLSPYLKIDRETCEIRPLDPWEDLKAYVKILLYLIARKAMKAYGVITDESDSALEIMRKTGLKKGTVNPALRGLLNDRLVEQTKEKKYYVPNHAIEKIKEMLIKK
jgi:hypothetical protein